MEAGILEAEDRLAFCFAAAEDPTVSSDHEALAERHAALGRAQIEVDRLYARWAELEAKTRQG